MVKQYPHRVVFTTKGNATQDANGDMTPGTPVIVEHTGRIEANTSGSFLTDTDGKRLDYSWMLYMPLPVPKIKPGATVEVYNGTDLVCETRLIRLHPGQLNARVWL